MHSSNLVRTDSLPRLPWKNGAGTTREITAAPAPDSSAGHLWRLSVADLTEDAPFSAFPFQDRHFLIASAKPVFLTVDGEVRTAASGRPERFPGEAAVAVELPNGPATAINLMTARKHCTGALDVRELDGEVTFEEAAAAVVVLKGRVESTDGTVLDPLDALILGDKPVTLRLSSAVVAVAQVVMLNR